MIPDVVAVKALASYKLEARFSDGEIRRFDMTPYMDYPAFSSLREEGLFMRAKVSHGTVVWTDEIDLSPDTLYLRGERLIDDSTVAGSSVCPEEAKTQADAL